MDRQSPRRPAPNKHAITQRKNNTKQHKTTTTIESKTKPKVGPRPADASVVTYLQRLREQGWDVTRTERKLLMAGGSDAAAILGAALSRCLAGVFGGGWMGGEWEGSGARRAASTSHLIAQ